MAGLEELLEEAAKNRGLHMAQMGPEGEGADPGTGSIASRGATSSPNPNPNHRGVTRLTRVNAAQNESIAFMRRLQKSSIANTSL